MRQNGCPVKLGEGEDWSWTFLSASSLSYLNDWRASHATNVSWRAADPGGCPWGPPFPQHTISRFGESTRQLEDVYDWRMALDFGLRKLDIFWPYCAEEKGTVGSMACNSASLPCFCRAFWDVSHHFIPVICCGKKSPKVNVFQKNNHLVDATSTWILHRFSFPDFMSGTKMHRIFGLPRDVWKNVFPW